MKVVFTVNGHNVTTPHQSLTGRQIKELGHEVDPTLDLGHELVLEGGAANGADKVIGDDETVDFHPDHIPGHTLKAFFTRPPTNFGTF